MRNVILLIFIMLFATACSGQRVESGSYDLMLKMLLSNSTNEISVDSLQQVQEQVTLLDARSPEEYRVSHIKNAKFVGYKTFDSISVAKLDKIAPIVVYCSIGYRSEKITGQLKKMGFKNVSNLYGGIFEWKNQGHLVVNANGPTNRMHAYNRAWGLWLNKGEKVYSTNIN